MTAANDRIKVAERLVGAIKSRAAPPNLGLADSIVTMSKRRDPHPAPVLQALDPAPEAEAPLDAVDDPQDHDDRLIAWMLRRSPQQRLEALQGFVDGISELRHARKISQ